MQHLLAVYSQEFQSPAFFLGADSSAAEIQAGGSKMRPVSEKDLAPTVEGSKRKTDSFLTSKRNPTPHQIPLFNLLEQMVEAGFSAQETSTIARLDRDWACESRDKRIARRLLLARRSGA